MPDKELQCPQVGYLCGCPVVMLATFSRERMTLFRIIMNRNQRVFAERSMNLLLSLWRAKLILTGNMQHQWRRKTRHFVQRLFNADAVIAHGTVRLETNREQPGQVSSQTESNAAHTAR